MRTLSDVTLLFADHARSMLGSYQWTLLSLCGFGGWYTLYLYTAASSLASFLLILHLKMPPFPEVILNTDES